MKRILLAVWIILWLGLPIGVVQPALAQGCGPTNPNCTVPDRPAGDSTNAAANTRFVHNNIGPIIPTGLVGDCATDNAPQIQAAINSIAATGGTVQLPQPASCYGVSTTITIPTAVILQGVGANTCIRPLASMTSVIKLTGIIASKVANLCVSNMTSRATNGIEFAPTVFGNNLITAERVWVYSFVNNFLNSNADFFHILHSWSQGATGFSVRSTYSGTQSVIDDLSVLGDNAGIYYSPGSLQTTEGAIITNSDILVTGTGKAIQFDQALFLQISNVNVTGAVYLNGTVNAIADTHINALFIGPSGGASDTIGFIAEGNIADLNINGLTSANFSACGVQLKSGAVLTVQRAALRGLRLTGNGTGAGSADLCINASLAAVTGITVSDSWFESTGGSVVSIVEDNTHTVTASYGPNNNFFGAITTTRLNVPPVSGGVPFINSSLLLSYTGVLTANGVVYGGGAGLSPGVTAAGTNGQLFLGQSGAAPAWASCGGDCSTITAAGLFTMGKLNGVVFGASPGTNTVPVVTGSNTVTYETVPVAAGGTNCAVASGTCVDNISGFSSTGFINRTGAGAYSFQALGLSTTKNVRAAGGAGDCSLIFTNGLLTGGTC